MTDAYAHLIGRDPRFRERVLAFAELYPVLNVRDVKKKLGRDAFWQMDREGLIEACRLAEVKSQPQGWNPGELPTWPQLLRTIYLIRCNLFRGRSRPRTAVIDSLCGAQIAYCEGSLTAPAVSTGTIERCSFAWSEMCRQACGVSFMSDAGFGNLRVLFR